MEKSLYYKMCKWKLEKYEAYYYSTTRVNSKQIKVFGENSAEFESQRSHLHLPCIQNINVS